MEKFDKRNSRHRALVGPRLSWLVVLVAIVLSGVALGAGIEADEDPNGVANLPADAPSALAGDLAERIGGDEVTPAFVVLDRGGEQLSGEDRRAVEELVGRLSSFAVEGEQVFPAFSEDGEAALVGVPLSGTADQEQVVETVEDLRAEVDQGLPEGLDAQVTGGPAFLVDLAGVFDGADVTLLVATASVVALLLLITYRSPWLWLVPLAVVGVADQVAITVVAIGTKVLPFATDGASVGITSVLVFGAGTNYALLLIARYREELRLREDRFDAMRHAVGRAAPAILASSGTVVLALLTLGFADSPNSRNIGLGGALGIVTAVVYALGVLPAAMTVCGRWLFWPFVPRVGQAEPTRTGFWSKVAGVVTGRPVVVTAASLVVLVLLALPLLGLRTGLSQTEQFRATPESVTGQEVLAEHFPAGATQPTTVVTREADAGAVEQAVGQVEGVQQVMPGAAGDGFAVLSLTLDADPASDEAFAAVERIRDAASGVDPDALVGGPDAEALDSSEAAARDRLLIIPLVLLVVLAVLLVLLRSVVGSIVLVLTVVATYVAALGAGWLVFDLAFGFPALDLTVPLLSFLFLVALGVDYNIFLTTRAKEEAEEGADPRAAISVALAVTGGVITSAGVLLAAVFTVLGVLPLITLTQIGVIVGIGVLLDTLLVRSVLVPALVTLLGRRFWWPGHLSREPAQEPSQEPSASASGASR